MAEGGGAYLLPGAELEYAAWIARYAPSAALCPMAVHHDRAWNWFEELTPGVRPPALIECWSRGHGKSTTVELALSRQAVKATRRFALYVSSQQAAANRHVQHVATRMERVGIARAVNQYGFSKGWNANLCRTANGFNVLALGLNVAVRGVKLDEFRPDVILLDDIDELGDSLKTIQDKIAILTQSVLPAGSVDVAVAFFQNAIHQHSLMSQALGGTLDMLRRRVMHPAIPAVRELAWERYRGPDGETLYRITGGTPTWDGKPLAVCENEMNDTGLVSFLRECQHDTSVGGVFFADWNRDVHVVHVDDINIEKHWTFLGGYDWGRGKPFCFLLAAVDERGRVVFVDEEYAPGKTNPEQAQLVLECLERNGVHKERVVVWADPSMWARKDDGRGKKVADVEAFQAAGLRFQPANNNRRHGWSNFVRYLRDRDQHDGEVKTPFLRVLNGKCPNLIRTIPQQVPDAADVEDLDTDGEDHAVDAARYLLASKPRPSGTNPGAPQPADHRPQWLKQAEKQGKRKL